jgi:hypothetical protein
MSKLRLLTKKENGVIDSGVLLRDLLPVTIGDFTMNSFVVECVMCHEVISEDRVLGDITHFGTSVAVVNAVAHCPECMMLTSLMRRIRCDERGARMEWQGEDGVWFVAELPVPRMTKIRNWLTRLFWR